MDFSDLPSFADQISADPDPESKTDRTKHESHFISRCNPQRLGNLAPIAFGGCVISIAVHAAHQTLPIPPSSNPRDQFNLYSVLGTFHGPTKVDRKLNCTVQPTRNTKTFATRRVIAWQTLDNNTKRTCADFFIDFHKQEPTSLLEYDAPPTNPDWLTRGPLDPDHTATFDKILARLLEAGQITQIQKDTNLRIFRLAIHLLETRYITSSPSAINMMGLAPHLGTPQDHLPLPSKTSGEWLKTRLPWSNVTRLSSMALAALNAAALSFTMDQALSFLPLNHTHRGFQHASACSTLEFALRVFVPGRDLDMSRWHLRERKTHQGGGARTYSEGRLWEEGGRMVCCMTQACILRPPLLRSVDGGVVVQEREKEQEQGKMSEDKVQKKEQDLMKTNEGRVDSKL